jgi:hypothetical protein
MCTRLELHEARIAAGKMFYRKTLVTPDSESVKLLSARPAKSPQTFLCKGIEDRLERFRRTLVSSLSVLGVGLIKNKNA